MDSDFPPERAKLTDDEIDTFFGSLQEGIDTKQSALALMGHYISEFESAKVNHSNHPELSNRTRAIFDQWIYQVFDQIISGTSASQALGLTNPPGAKRDPRKSQSDMLLTIGVDFINRSYTISKKFKNPITPALGDIASLFYGVNGDRIVKDAYHKHRNEISKLFSFDQRAYDELLFQLLFDPFGERETMEEELTPLNSLGFSEVERLIIQYLAVRSFSD